MNVQDAFECKILRLPLFGTAAGECDQSVSRLLFSNVVLELAPIAP
jgi:hypothetical protein